MRVLFVSRKKDQDIGGLNRFSQELFLNFPEKSFLLSPSLLKLVFKLPNLKITHIHLTDGTILPFGVLLKLFLRKPLTLTFLGFDLTWNNFFYQQMLKLLLPFVDGIVFLSHFTSSKFHFPAKVPQKVIKLGISTRHLRKRIQFKLPVELNQKIVLGSVSNLVKRKGHVFFLKEVLVKLDEKYIYLMIGGGPEEEQIRETISEFNLQKRAFLLGQLSNSKLAFILSQTDIFICHNIPLETNIEGMGIAWGEAAALGIPIIATKVDGIPEIIHHGKNGLLVKPKPEEIIKAILSLKEKKKRTQLGKKAKRYTQKNFSWKEVTREYLSFFEEVGSKN